MPAPLDQETLTDEDLVLYYYGESRGSEEIRRRIGSSAAARARYDELCRVLDAAGALPVPEPDLQYGARVWNRLQADLEAERSLSGWKKLGSRLKDSFVLPRLRAVGALAAMLAVAFFAGRFAERESADTTPFSSAGRERILASVVADHLERSERLLRELANAPGDARIDISLERENAETLLSANRLYRQTTERSDEVVLTSVLSDLERLLLDLARGPHEISAGELDDVRPRIEDLLFKVQVLGLRLRLEEQKSAPRAATPSRDGHKV